MVMVVVVAEEEEVVEEEGEGLMFFISAVSTLARNSRFKHCLIFGFLPLVSGGHHQAGGATKGL